MRNYLSRLYDRFMQWRGYVKICYINGREEYVTKRFKELHDEMLKVRDISELALPELFAEQVAEIKRDR